ncbi:MAG: ABC transporter substrate-binding protein, partial [Oscillospiraceae bacterium]|nr:ABC transporter substrate-binding protein [Oscillospiraceae bacterium]
VLVLLVLNNVREVRQERRAASQELRKPSFFERLSMRFNQPSWKWVRRGTAAAMACAFVVVTVLLSGAAYSQPVVNVCSWGEYIDEDLITQFEDATGIRVNYQTAESNEALYSLLKSGGADYDVIVPSDYMISQLIEEGMLEELDYSQIPNFELIDQRFRNLSYDPENKYTVPYTWGTLGLIYNASMVDGEPDSWGALYDDRYAGNVLLINNSRDAIGAALLHLGYSVNTTSESEIREAFSLISGAMGRGVFQGKVMDQVFQKMEGGNAAIAAYYAGDYLSMVDNQADDVDLRFVIPEEGGNWFVDAMCVLRDAPHYDNALKWINFIASTGTNLANMDYIGYASPNTEALEGYPAYYEELYGEELDPELYAIMAAPAEVLERCEMYTVLPPATRTLYNDLWIQLGT